MSLLKSTCLFFFLTLGFALPAQIWEGSRVPVPELPRFTFRTVHPLAGLSGEYRLYGGLTAFATVNTSLWTTYNERSKLRIMTPAYFSGGVNWYHNLKKRMAEGKDVSHFAGNFISLSTTRYIWDGQYTRSQDNSYALRNRPNLNLSYNIRRNFGRNNRFYVEFGAGAAFSGDRDVFGKFKVLAAPLINLKIGINLK